MSRLESNCCLYPAPSNVAVYVTAQGLRRLDPTASIHEKSCPSQFEPSALIWYLLLNPLSGDALKTEMKLNERTPGKSQNQNT
ncbi:hypothetical protein RB195_010247 [Necator americanus]|uniref:Uncharacterized protein n=1 Tax=Necator americanus TaxID=51031 RepID=A0ABR1CX32_NECAM